ncbi:helix-turn-helix domain-containing protein [Bacillus gobiensis]|uniref:helix-turn-helix domain-containing protein n=1 Tax=Bacillus gobiensis TaxID=1441095 RepID=UPI003D19E949
MHTTLTVQEAADYLRVHYKTIYSMVQSNEIPHHRVRRRIFFSKDTLDAWIKKQENAILDQEVS